MFGKNGDLDLDPKIFHILDPDAQIFQIMDPDPHEMDADPEPCLKLEANGIFSLQNLLTRKTYLSHWHCEIS